MTITQIDFSILNGIQNLLQCSFCDFFFKLITKFGDGGIFWIITSAALIIPKKTRRLGITLLCTLAICFITYHFGLKKMIGRLRPYQQNPSFHILIGEPSGSSFPSGHCASSFCIATIYFLFRKTSDFAKRCWIPVLVLSILIAFSRLYLYVHFPSDVIAGTAVGIAFGTAGYFISTRCIKFENKE